MRGVVVGVFVIAATTLLVAVGRAAPTATLALSGPSLYATFSLTNDGFGDGVAPLVFAHTDTIGTATLSYETDTGATVAVAGTPRRWDVVDDGAGFVAEWVLEGGARAVRVEVRYAPSLVGGDNDAGYWRVQLGAVPGEDNIANPIRRWAWVHRLGRDEMITGLMEKIRDGFDSFSWYRGITRAFDMRNQTVQMFVKPTVAMYAPLYLSTAGYGVFTEGTFPGLYDLGRTDPDLVATQWRGSSVALRVFTGGPMAVVQQHALLTGPPVAAPAWNFGVRRWRNEHRNYRTFYDGTPVTVDYNGELLEDVLMFLGLQIPLGTMWIDRPWGLGPMGYQDFEFDPEQFPNVGPMVEWLTSLNVTAMLWIAPWVQGDMAREIVRLGYQMPGQRPSLTRFYCTNDPCILVDFTNPAAVAWWQASLQKVLDLGFIGFKLDRSEELVPASPDETVFDGRTTLEVRNDYPVLFQRASYEACERSYPRQCVIMPRATYTGSTAYSLPWGGDTEVSHEGLRSAIIASQKAGMIGFPSWGSDTGGYDSLPPSELLQRWTEFSAFNPIFSYGPTGDRGPWNMGSEPKYDIEALAVLRTYAIVHERLVPYTVAASDLGSATGMPIVRSLLLLCPRDPGCREDYATFQYGADLLVGAIWENGARTRRMYLPPGDAWRDAWNSTAAAVPGGQWVTMPAPLHQLPVFIRDSSNVDLGDLQALYEQSRTIVSVKPDLAALQRQIPPPTPRRARASA
jgi:alpha-D-xyloside xylohydrolase